MFVRESTPDGKISYWTIKPEANRCLTLDQVYKVSISAEIFSTRLVCFLGGFFPPISSALLTNASALLCFPTPLQPALDPAAPPYPQTMQVSYQQVRLSYSFTSLCPHLSQTDRTHGGVKKQKTPRSHVFYSRTWLARFRQEGSRKHDHVYTVPSISIQYLGCVRLFGETDEFCVSTAAEASRARA